MDLLENLGSGWACNFDPSWACGDERPPFVGQGAPQLEEDLGLLFGFRNGNRSPGSSWHLTRGTLPEAWPLEDGEAIARSLIRE